MAASPTYYSPTQTDHDLARAERAGYSHLLVTHHTIRKGNLAGVTVRSSFGLCSEADAIDAREKLGQALDVVSSTIYAIPR